MSQEPPIPPPVDPWADATDTESLTPHLGYPRAAWEVDRPAVPEQPRPVRPPDGLTGTPVGRALAGGGSASVTAGGGGGRRVLLAVLAVAVVATLATGGIVLGRALAGNHGHGTGPDAHGTAGAAISGPPGSAPAGGASTAPAGGSSTAPPTGQSSAPAGSPSTGPTPSSAPARPHTPDDALALSDAQAVAELGTEADENTAAVAALAGGWVPQVDGKCVGVPVDIQPSFVPDGTPDVPHVTIRQILAFHLSLHQRFGALTVRPSQLGIGTDTATSGPCAGQVIWNSVVPQAFGSPQDANAWCDVHVPPVHECLARYVARTGEAPKVVERV